MFVVFDSWTWFEEFPDVLGVLFTCQVAPGGSPRSVMELQEAPEGCSEQLGLCLRKLPDGFRAVPEALGDFPK